MKILIADDDPVTQHLLVRQITSWGYEAVTARDGAEAWAILREPESPRIAILDWVMPGVDGVEICRRVRDQAQEPYVYLLLLTAKQRREDIVEGLDAGADDYVSKPFDLAELKVRLRAAVRVIALQTELVAAREALRFQATHDRLTDTWNRGAVHQLLEREARRASCTGQSLGVAMIDLDFFKTVNDTYGHPAGDVVLKSAAERIRSAVRADDVVGRYGGEEFLVVLPACNAAEAAGIGERIRAAVAARAVRLALDSVGVTASVGVAAMGHGADAEQLIAAADAALYSAKRNGRNRVEIGVCVAETSEPRRRSTLPSPVSVIAATR